jgi:lipid-A-disaccharide synthase
MAAAGVELHYPLTDLAVMGFGRVVRHMPTFFALADRAERYFRTRRPDSVVLIDYPGFNFALAKRAHAAGVPVHYFVPPQLWGWRRGRVRKVRKWCTSVLTALPFEDEWFRSRGVRAHYTGHPYFDELARQRLDPEFLAEQRAKGGPIVGLLPGSRNHEVAANFGMMLAAARRVRVARPDVRFLVAAFNDRQAAAARAATATGSGGRPVEVHVGRTPEVIELADACVAVSGSVSLELMYRAKPTAIVYRANPVTAWLAQRFFMKVPYITLVNLLAGEELFPEIVATRDEPEWIAGHVLGWLNNPVRRLGLVERLASLRDRVAAPGACDRAAAFLLERVAARGARAA